MQARGASTERWAPPPRRPADGSAPSPEFTIKGNADSKLYHRPGTRFFESTVAEIWFADEASAEAAGYSLPKSQQEDASDSE